MKKILLAVVVALAGAFASAEVFKDSEKIVEDFLARGSYIKIVVNKNNISYCGKNAITGINIDEDDMELCIADREGKDFFDFGTSYNVKKWNFESDENGNIIITSKKK